MSRTLRSAAAAALLLCAMYAGEDGEVCVELGYVGGKLSAPKATKPDKSKVGGRPVRLTQARLRMIEFSSLRRDCNYSSTASV